MWSHVGHIPDHQPHQPLGLHPDAPHPPHAPYPSQQHFALLIIIR